MCSSGSQSSGLQFKAVFVVVCKHTAVEFSRIKHTDKFLKRNMIELHITHKPEAWFVDFRFLNRNLNSTLPILPPCVLKNEIFVRLQVFAVCHLHSAYKIFAENLTNNDISGFEKKNIFEAN